MNVIKRSVCLLLTAVFFLGLLPTLGTGAAAATLKERQQAAVMTAFAYFDKGRPVQYDSISLTRVSRARGGAVRGSHDASPEDASPDETIYTVCSHYCWLVYYDAFRYKLHSESPVFAQTGAMLKKYMPSDDPICVFKYDSSVDDTPPKEVADKMLAVLQPGDVLVEAGKVGNNGHAMFFVGDYYGNGTDYILHCSGSKYDMQTGEDVIECNPGSIPTISGKQSIYRLDQDRNDGGISFTTYDGWVRKYFDKVDKAKKKNRVFVVLRPLNAMSEAEYPMTEAAKGRLKYPRLLYNRTASPYTRFNDVPEGGNLTLSIELKNCSDRPYTLPVKETIPNGVSLAKVSHDGAVSGSEIRWNVPLNAGESKTLTVDYTVTAKRGETLVFTGGSVDTIPSNTLRIPVGGKHLTEAEEALLLEVADGKHMELFKDMPKDMIPTQVWHRLLNLNVSIPTVRQVVTNLLDKKPFNGQIYVFSPRNDLQGELQTFRNMIVPEFWGGNNCGEMDTRHRVLDLRCDYLQPGDIVYQISKHTAPSVGQTLVYLGNSKFLKQDRTDSGARIGDFFELQRSHTFNLFYVVRPTLAYDDVHALGTPPEEAKLQFTDVQKSDWYYIYVNELVKNGMIGGMTETTFAPNGTLTYGQALKLITLAVGEKEPAKTGSHWASGYLKLARDQLWLTKDVDLDAPITRLELCKIAAEAKGLRTQPKKNPFKDTDDEAVLALYKAEVIGGMSATMFGPNEPLTRAQISKIMYLLCDAVDETEARQTVQNDEGD